MDEPRADSLDLFRQQADLSRGELWLRYFALGGMSTAFQLEAFLYGALRPALTITMSSPTPSTNDSSSWAGTTRFPTRR